MRQFDFLDTLTGKARPEMCAFATSPSEVERVANTGKRVIMTGLENGYPVGEDLANVKAFYDRGARYITLTHSGHNQIGDSSSDRNPPRNNGLSPFGKQVVAEMNRLGHDGGRVPLGDDDVLGRHQAVESAHHRLALGLQGRSTTSTATSTTSS